MRPSSPSLRKGWDWGTQGSSLSPGDAGAGGVCPSSSSTHWCWGVADVVAIIIGVMLGVGAMWYVVVVVAGAGHHHCHHWGHLLIVVIVVDDGGGDWHVNAGGGVMVMLWWLWWWCGGCGCVMVVRIVNAGGHVVDAGGGVVVVTCIINTSGRIVDTGGGVVVVALVWNGHCHHHHLRQCWMVVGHPG